MAEKKILLPYNFTEMDQKALDFVIRNFSHQKDIEITLFHIYTPLPAIDTDSSTVMGRLSSSMQHLAKQLREKEEALKDARDYLLKNGFTENQLNYIFRARGKQLADEIVETARKGKYPIVVLNYRSYRITRLFTQSVHAKIVSSLKDITVCIVT